MVLTVGQMLQLVRADLESETVSMSRNACIRKLSHLEGQLGPRLGKGINIPVEEKDERLVPSEDFSKRSQKQSVVAEDPKDAETVEEKKKPTRKRRTYTKKEV